jgi:hypothetical protein
MPVFERHTLFGSDRIALEARELVMAGWTGRDPAAVQRHVDELAVLGVAAPSRVPLFYRLDPALLAGAVGTIEVLGADTSGEVETVLLALADGLWVGLGSDHTDRAMERHGVAISKQLCRKPLARELWRFEEVIPHWDQLVLRAVADSERRLYMEDALVAVRHPEDLIAAYAASSASPKGPRCRSARSCSWARLPRSAASARHPASRWSSPTRCSAAASTTPTTSAPCRS